MKKKEYTTQNLTVVWQPDLCVHSGICVKGLPEVFKPKQSPWIELSNADSKAIIEQVKRCPSGALTLKNISINMENPISEKVRVEVIPNGPLVIHTSCAISKPNGEIVEKENRASMCRCGASANKPFCDGAHKQIEFVG